MQLEAQRVTAALVDGESLEHGRDGRSAIGVGSGLTGAA